MGHSGVVADLVTIKTRVSRPVMEALAEKAAANERSIAAEIRVALTEHLNGAAPHQHREVAA